VWELLVCESQGQQASGAENVLLPGQLLKVEPAVGKKASGDPAPSRMTAMR